MLTHGQENFSTLMGLNRKTRSAYICTSLWEAWALIWCLEINRISPA